MNTSVRIFISECVLVSLISSQVFMPITGYTEDIVIIDDTAISSDVSSDTTTNYTSNEDIPSSKIEDGSIEAITEDEIPGSIIEAIEDISETTDTGSTDTGSTDTGSTDTGSTDTGSTDTGSIDNITDTDSDPALMVSTGTISAVKEGEITVDTVSLVEKDIYSPVSREDASVDTTVVETNQILIQFHDNLVDLDKKNSEFEVYDIETTAGINMTEIIAGSNIAVMELSEIENPLEDIIPSMEFVAEAERDTKIDTTIAELKTDPRVEHVQRNFRYELMGLGKKGDVTSYSVTYTGRSLPNEGSSSNMWGLDNQGQTIEGTPGTVDADIDYPEAMSYASGRLSSTGGVIVAVLDTGIYYHHIDLQGHLWDGTNCLSDTGAYLGGCRYGYDFAYGDKLPLDQYGHGTHVIGTISAVSNNGTGMVGVAPNVQIMAVQVLDDFGFGDTLSIVRGINFANRNGAKVINMSLGYTLSSYKESDFDYLTYNAIKDFSGIVTAAAGNDGILTEKYKSFPAGFGTDTTVSGEYISGEELIISGEVTIPGLMNVISVGASDQNDNLAGFSNYGSGTVHIAAPGVNIYSTHAQYDMVSGEISYINYTNGWVKEGGANSNNWNSREELIITDDGMDFSGVLWGDTRIPYVSGESSYIEKYFQNTSQNISSIWISAGCDSPDNYFDRIDVLMRTDGLYTKEIDFNEYRLYNFSSLTKTFEINGYSGSFGSYPLWSDTLAKINTSTGFSLRLNWVSTSTGLLNFGCFVKDIQINTYKENPTYKYMDGTSMATPHVAGAAALAWNFKPDATTQEIRNAIIYSGDYKPQLAGKVMHGSRLNVLNMLQALETPRVVHQTASVSGESGIKLRVETNLSTVDFEYPTVLLSNNTGFISDMGTNITWNIHGSSVDNKNVFYEYDALDADTTYYYKLIYCGLIYCDEVSQNTYYIFHTPSVVTQTLSGTVVKNEDIAIDNASATGVVFSGGTASGKIILTNTGTNTSVEIPTYRLIISASGTWDGIIGTPKTYTGNKMITTTNGTLTATHIEQIGSDIASLALSGQVATIHIPFSAVDGTQVPVYRANTVSDIFMHIATCTISNNICTFTTNHFSAFALGQGISPVVGGSNFTTGPGGGISISIGQALLSNMMTKPLGTQGIILGTGILNTGNAGLIDINYRSRTATLKTITDISKTLTAEELAGKIIDTINDSISIYGTIIKYDIMINFIKYQIRTNSLEKEYYSIILLQLQKERNTLMNIFSLS